MAHYRQVGPVPGKRHTLFKDADGRITLPGFYDGVEELSDALRADWAAELEEVRNTMLGLRDQLRFR